MVSDLPEFARDVSNEAKSRVRSALPWLPDPFTCNDCQTACKATQGFVEQQAQIMDIYECPNCESRFYREESDGFSTDPYNRR